MTASFQAQSMQQMQHAAMISQQAGFGMRPGEHMMGSAMNAGAAIGAPMAMGAMGLMGFDPMSLGASAGMSAMGRFGVAGGMGVGLGVAGAVGVPMMAAQYAGNQMMTGANQQQTLNAQMRNAYTFSSATGKGFSGSELGDIGGSLRQMSQQRGPGGEFASFDELGRMASMMGRMGLSQGVRNAKEFNDQFQQLTKTVKEIAQSFSTSLEEAMQVMGSMKSSGIFKNQGNIANQIKSFANAGGLATSEVTSMMGIGSQISRMVGGRGASGANGGMQTIGQIGIAQQMGLVSEEDIYNATGMTGAEGRQAFATNMMQGSARWLKGGQGRRFLASIAGKDGQLDEASVEEYMAGGVGTGRTMEMAGKNLGKVGRANFIRNEGRLRGEALGKFGGLTNVMAMRGWLEERGFDLSSGKDDRASIFMQRQLGMGSDEADVAVKMARDLPLLMRQRETANADADYRQQLDMQRKNMGIEGVKKKLESARNQVQGVLQQAGADFYQSGSNMLERWVNQLTDDYVNTISTDVGGAIRDVMGGGAIGRSVGKSRFGIGAKSTFGTTAASAIFGGGTHGMTGAQAFVKSGDAERFSAAGYNISTGSDASVSRGVNYARRVGAAYQEGGGSELEGLGGDTRDELIRMAAHGGMKGRGADRLSNFSRILEQSKDPKLQGLALQYAQANNEERARIMGSVMRGAGLGGFDSTFMGTPETQGIALSGFRTDSDRNTALGGYMLGGMKGRSGAVDEKVLGKATRGDIVGAIAKGFIPGSSMGLDFGLGEQLGRAAKGKYNESLGAASNELAESAGRFMLSEDGLSRARGALSGNADVRRSTLRDIETRNIELQMRAGDAGRDMNNIEKGEFEANRSMLMAADVQQLMDETGGKPTDEQKAEIVRKHGAASWEDAMKRSQGVAGAVSEEQKGARKELFRRVGQSGRADMSSLRSSGLFAGGKLTAKAIGSMGKVGSVEQIDATGAMGKMLGADKFTGDKMAATTGQQFMAAMARASDLQSQMSGEDSLANEHLLHQSQSAQDDGQAALSRMSVADKKKLADELRKGGGPAGLRSMVMRQAGIEERLGKAKARGGAGGVDKSIAQMLGVDVSDADLKGLDADAAADLIAQQALGSKFGTDEGKGFQEQLRASLKASREGRMGQAAGDLDKLQGASVLGDARKEKQDEQAKSEDPSFRKLESIAKGITELKDALKPLSGELKVNITNDTINVKESES